MRGVWIFVVYMVLTAGANAGAFDDLAALREGDMRKLQFHEDALPAPSSAFVHADGQAQTLEAWRGKYVLLNFWATWCAPCRHEMPMLSELQTAFAGDKFEVITIATGRNGVDDMRRFFKEIGVSNLPLHRDPKQILTREMAVRGLPVTVLMDPQGREIARMVGPADWSAQNAQTLITAMLARDAQG